ncbi:MAG TPA: filamentous hemagglutinin N-terminal domain-containing protein [Methylomusa anaerophila]|uniref:Heme/hemopexin-binding protein n=1 Tax=Methylomusa anaerophila TaxID=1930071 RepID=A0A348AGA7_9FIRM|nr:filamentous hemagglutinin N-terminal domain-containing protein [Methylomusa anaerophila]BBB90105.1 heme/hemopexin-binding protein precursor [Methylomusa anaerophila]HML88170.1 filamentous hemagglutinin N-terminal domain-containing protein [Methylomusa anaerophila]
MQRSWRRTWERCKDKGCNLQGAMSQKGNNSMKTLAKGLLPPVMAISLTLAAVTSVYANPAGGTVTVGKGAISENGQTMTITQKTNKLGINWQTFGINAGETVNFLQPSASAIALNRVVGNDASVIYGALSANGKVFLINPNGILFACGSQVNVGGLVASTLNISDSDFKAGKFDDFSGSGGSVVNHGNIMTTTGGYVALLGRKVSNRGIITAKQGTVALAAGKEVTLDFAGDKLLSLAVNRSAFHALADNRHLIRADGGQVIMAASAADALAGTVINNTGTIQAKSINNVNGVIRLEGGTNGTVANSGVLDASVRDAGSPGGTITVRGDNIHIAGAANIKAAGDLVLRAGTGGTGAAASTVTIDPGAAVSGKNVAIYYNPVSYTDAATKSDGSGNSYSDKVTGSLTAYMLVNDVNQLQAMNTNLAGYYGLSRDVDASATASWNDGAGFAPVGPAWNSPFTGKFDGGGHTITGLTINRPSTDDVGLFGYAQNATISNVGLVNETITGRTDIGGLVGSNYGYNGTSSITNCYSTGTVTGTYVVGGLVGVNFASAGTASITNCYSTSSVEGEMNLGGLAGDNYATAGTASITNSYSTGTVTGTYAAVGGLVGINHTQNDNSNNNNSTASIANCYSTSRVYGDKDVGGLVGDNFAGYDAGWWENNYDTASTANITNSYSTGTVTGNYEVGGLVGLNETYSHYSYDTTNNSTASVTNSYSTGAVSGGYFIGGLTGHITSDGGTVTITNTYWDNQTSGQSIGVGSGGSSGVTGLTTAQMKQKNSYAGWDFTNTWNITSGYPFLRWQQ